VPIPRNPKATIGVLFAILAFGATAASAGPPAVRGCARASGNCSGKKLVGKHYIKMTLTNSRWVKTMLYQASFRFSDLYGSRFRGANLSRADLSHGNRTQSDFRGANMSRADLRGADFWGSNLRKANLRGAIVVNTRFDNTNLFFADFTGAYLKHSSFNGARLCHTVQPNGEERNDNCSKRGANGNVPSGGDPCLPNPPKGCGKKDKGKTDSGKDDSSGNNGQIVGTL
jgi:uncharacterized protein YjbI with pentapeptide repeats